MKEEKIRKKFFMSYKLSIIIKKNKLLFSIKK